eukprot:2734565-Rhodomonas_salina.4
MAFRATAVTAFRSTGIVLARRAPSPDAPTQFILRTIESKQPATVEQIWSEVAEATVEGEKVFQSKRHMKRCIDFLREQQRVAAKPPTTGVNFQYVLGRRPNIIPVASSQATSS